MFELHKLQLLATRKDSKKTVDSKMAATKALPLELEYSLASYHEGEVRAETPLGHFDVAGGTGCSMTGHRTLVGASLWSVQLTTPLAHVTVSPRLKSIKASMRLRLNSSSALD